MASVGIKVARSTSNLCDMTNSYKNNSTPRGYCLIINNETFKSLKPRKGSQKDVKNLRQLFKDLGYEIWGTEANTSNLTAQEMKIVVKDFAASDKHNSVDSSIVAILSHGGAEDVIYGVDEKEVSFTNDILRLFEGHNAPGLMQKPKLFILQECRGGHFM
ncbi:PREDICTED: cell death protein 3-like [Priapulus caudatus]|uniref:Cell death protein 3-like n=1 Tax=Priapulus caudatus TaxID=37621 RepID=A0ABM1EZI9_PRICU|nr:PREDICTED: cell death protein 3-like [Priapulus caudatus]